jgi:hypothetical protein
VTYSRPKTSKTGSLRSRHVIVLTISKLDTKLQSIVKTNDTHQKSVDINDHKLTHAMTASIKQLYPRLEATLGMNGPPASFDEEASYDIEVKIEEDAREDVEDKRHEHNRERPRDFLFHDVHSLNATNRANNRDPARSSFIVGRDPPHAPRPGTESGLISKNPPRKTISWVRDFPSPIPGRTREQHHCLKTVGSDCTATTVSINHTFSSESTSAGSSRDDKKSNAASRAARGFMLGMSKPVLIATVAIVLASTGAGVWGWMSISGLNTQIQELEREVDRLEEQNDRYEVLNSELNTTVASLQLLNDDLKDAAVRLAISVNELNASVTNLQIVNEQLTQANARYSALNIELQETANVFSDKVDLLNENVSNLTLHNQELENITLSLNQETETLNRQNDNLSQTVLILNESLTDLSEANARLSSHNTDLSRIVSFLNDTATDINRTLDDLTRAIAEQIEINRLAAVQSLENRFIQQATFWDCSFRDVFRGESFILDEDSPIVIIGDASAAFNSSSPDNYTRVMEYVEDRVLSKLCLNASDLKRHMMDMMNVDSTAALASASVRNQLSVNILYRAVAELTTAAMRYYFPEIGAEGLTVDDWAQANYDCHGVPPPFAFPSL